MATASPSVVSGPEKGIELIHEYEAEGTSGTRGTRPPLFLRGARSAPTSLRGVLDLAALLALPLAGAVLSEVPADWELVPAGVKPGEASRLLFVTYASRRAARWDIDSYNRFVRPRA